MKVFHRVEKQKPKAWQRRVKCADCTSTLGIEEPDLSRSIGRAPCETSNDWDDVWFECEVCGAENRVPDDEVSMSLRNRLPTSRERKNKGNLLECKIVRLRTWITEPNS